MVALIHGESEGNPLAVGPPTKYGRAYGSTQMLLPTAREMADKLGVQFKEEMFKSNSAEAIAYQYALGRAYLEQGLMKHRNYADAFRYYNAGPNQRNWNNTQTNDYVASGLGKLRMLGAV